VLRPAAQGQHGDRGERPEAREREAEHEPDRDRERLDGDRRADQVGAPPEREVERGEHRDRDSDVARQVRSRRAAAPPRPRGEQAAHEGDRDAQQATGDDQVEREDDEVARLVQQPAVEPCCRQRRREAEQHAADETDANGRAQRGGEGAPARCIPEHEAIERAVEVSEPAQLLADRLDRGERRSVRSAHGSQRPLKR
jgi:hypothetical protein